MSNITNTNERASIIRTNWICEGCPYFDMGATWSAFGACRAPFEERDGNVFLNGERGDVAVFEDDATPICARIATIGFVARRCEDDDRLHIRGDYGMADDGECYSRDYCRTNFYYCEECGTWITNYDDYDDELCMCEPCAREYRRAQYRVIGDWHEHKGNFEIIRANASDNDDRTIGFEMEVECYNGDHELMAHDIIDTFGNTFVFENDCSLNDGFEIISQPHTMQAFRELNLDTLEDMLTRAGYDETDDDATTGFHVHYSTAFLGDTNAERIQTFARLVRFYDDNFDWLCDITERKDIGHSYRNADEHWCDDYNDDVELTNATVDGTRYVAVNGNRFYRGTFEIRLCDGTIRADKVRAWVDFNIALMQCLQERETLNVRDVVPYLSDSTIDFFDDFFRA